MADSQAPTVLGDSFYNDPSQLSQALRQRAGSDKPLHFTTSTSGESRHSGTTASTGLLTVPQQQSGRGFLQPVVLAPTDRAPAPRRAAPANYVKPALSTHHSAPLSTAFVTDLVGALKMHHTFNGVDAPGDTQPDSQMHKQWTRGLHAAPAEVNHAPKSLFVDHDEAEDNDVLSDDMDAVDSSQEQHNAAITSPTVIDLDEPGGHMRDILALTSPLKFETPALAGRKRHCSEQTQSSAIRTSITPGTVPSASAFGAAFAFAGGPHMSLTQIWNNTQAPTSPAVGGAGDDVVFTRPSPNFTNARHSSPGPTSSSPIKGARPETPRSDPLVRSSSEPRAEYVTMKQSQEKRKSSIGEDENIVTVEQDSWEELSRQVQQKKAKARFHQRAAASLSHISAPKSATSRTTRKHTASANYPSPRRSRAERSVLCDGQQDEDDNSMDELSQTVPVKAHGAEDSPDELSQDVQPTARASAKHNSNHNKVLVPKTSSHPYRTPSGQASRNASQQESPSSQLQRESQLRAPGSQSLLRSGKGSVAVMDSQPDVLADFDSILPPKSLRFPSSPSANEYSINQTTVVTKTGYTSQVISSSMPPMPPKSSREEPDGVHEEAAVYEELRVPSSPPILTHDEEVDYDEHTYDEYADEQADQEARDAPSVDGDVMMEDEDDLPVAEGERNNRDPIIIGREDSDGEELDLVQPQQVEVGTDDEVPETLAQERPQEDVHEDALFEHDVPEHTPRLKRQDTVPETDALDETQPSFFPNNILLGSANNSTSVLHHTNSTGHFQTAQDEQSGSQSNQQATHSSKDDGSDTIHANHRMRSISDIYNLPATQQSNAEDDIEMPRLSGLDDEHGSLGRASSPPPQPAKRRKVTYAANRNVICVQPEVMPSSSALFNPPPFSPPNEQQRSPKKSPPIASATEREGREAGEAAHPGVELPAPYTRPVTMKDRVLPKTSKPQRQKKGALKPISKELIQSLSSPSRSPGKSRGLVPIRAGMPVTPTKAKAILDDKEVDVAILDAEHEPAELAKLITQPIGVERGSEGLVTPTETASGEILVPNRVFASWPGSHYYPATCVGRASTRQLRIRYDDGNITTMDTVHVRALEIRVGDHVKVDESGMKKHTYVVVALKDKIEQLGSELFPSTDQLGYMTVVLEVKRRDSMPKQKSMQPAEHISVPMASIYLTTGLWARLRDRSYRCSPPVSPTKSASRNGTPIAESFTSPSFTRRGMAIPSMLKAAAVRAASVASTTRSGSGVFTNMAFVLTSTTIDVDKEAIAKTIKTNGGQILEHGFHELFDYESSDVSSSQVRRRSASLIEGTDELTLKHAYKDLGFVALISDAHSRSTKYIQALALNVPCLHLRWVQDSLANSRAAPFGKFLLPAGVSKFLDPHGVVRSRTMQMYDPAAEDTSFAQTIQGRDLLLHNQTVLLVTGKSKKEIEKRQPFVFLTHALGSANVGRCADLADASEMLTDGHWDWVYVDNGERGVTDAAAELFGIDRPTVDTKAKKSKKRKRDENEGKEELIAQVQIEGRKIRITCAEFVIQSLILGALIED